jgi:hypothetical protein
VYLAVIIKVKFLTTLLKFEKFVSFFKCHYFTIYIYIYIYIYMCVCVCVCVCVYTNNCTVIRYSDIRANTWSFSALF